MQTFAVHKALGQQLKYTSIVETGDFPIKCISYPFGFLFPRIYSTALINYDLKHAEVPVQANSSFWNTSLQVEDTVLCLCLPGQGREELRGTGLSLQRPTRRLSAELGLGIRPRQEIPEFRCLYPTLVSGGGSVVQLTWHLSSGEPNPLLQWEVGRWAHSGVWTLLGARVLPGGTAVPSEAVLMSGVQSPVAGIVSPVVREGRRLDPPHKGWSYSALWMVWACEDKLQPLRVGCVSTLDLI